MATIDMGQGGLTNDFLNSTVFQGIQKQEDKLKTTMSSMASASDGNLTPTQMLAMQQQVQQWSIMIDIQSTITKQLAESAKSVVQKSG